MSICHRRGIRLASVVGFALSLQMLDGAAFSAASQERLLPFTCAIKPASTATPPTVAPPPANATTGNRTIATHPEQATPQPLCPPGQIPVVRQRTVPEAVRQNSGAGSLIIKGNPLLRPQTGGAQPLSGTPQPRFMPFNEVYGKAKRSPFVFRKATSAPACRGNTYNNDPTCYYYGSAAVDRSADGGGMAFSVDRPSYIGTGGAGHTLSEISIQGGVNNGNIVEIGWNVSTDQYGDPDPHIFVFHWNGWDPSCYDGCGWVQVSAAYYPGQNISTLVGREIYIGYVLYGGNWWAWFDSQWLGYFPGTLWENAFATTTLIQWFGEVATLNGVPPRNQMGDGIFPPRQAAARMSTLCDVDAPKWVCSIRNKQQLIDPSAPTYYNILRTGFGEVRYGGPGK